MTKLIQAIDQRFHWRWLSAVASWTIEKAITIQQIPAPTFAEHERATYVMNQFHAMKLDSVFMDDQFNVFGRLPGISSEPALMIVAHTDTVFPAETDLSIRRVNNLVYGPGLGDNSLGVAGLLTIIDILQKQQIRLPCDVWFVATSREEGLGDLGGMRAAFDYLKSRIKAVINLEGLSFGYVYHAGICVRRLRITVEADGGHSWANYGSPSAIHTLMQFGAQITHLTPPNTPRTTFNIGIIKGGHSINSIATQAELWLDLRSEDSATLISLEQQIHQLIRSMHTPETRFSVDVVGDRPGGSISVNHPLVSLARDALAQVGEIAVLETGSTDGNIALSAGCPTVTVGLTRGANAHRLDEYIETQPVAAGIRQLILLTLAAAETRFEA
ncbi:MAG: peptidase M20 [Phototrophicales bacterium]|nr:MAG: peptidase M20 [Phototrophicales bacterium]RMG72039.1 MAG: M20/M25/M40 family metallo-hydrolase [Chloroflexota bacterium]